VFEKERGEKHREEAIIRKHKLETVLLGVNDGEFPKRKNAKNRRNEKRASERSEVNELKNCVSGTFLFAFADACVRCVLNIDTL
jgi:ribosomal protein L32